MKKFARGLLWIAFVMMVCDIGALVTARRFIGRASADRVLAHANCGKLEEALTSVELSAWTNAQRKAFDDLCDGPKGFYRIDVGVPPEIVLGFLAIGGGFYLIAIIREAWQNGRREIESPDGSSE